MLQLLALLLALQLLLVLELDGALCGLGRRRLGSLLLLLTESSRGARSAAHERRRNRAQSAVAVHALASPWTRRWCRTAAGVWRDGTRLDGYWRRRRKTLLASLLLLLLMLLLSIRLLTLLRSLGMLLHAHGATGP